jgi:hypothetical protein
VKLGQTVCNPKITLRTEMFDEQLTAYVQDRRAGIERGCAGRRRSVRKLGFISKYHPAQRWITSLAGVGQEEPAEFEAPEMSNPYYRR